MGRQHDFRMNNAAFSCIVVGQSVPLVCQLLSGAVGCCGYGRFALSPADNLNAAMVDVNISVLAHYNSFRLEPDKDHRAIGLYCIERFRHSAY